MRTQRIAPVRKTSFAILIREILMTIQMGSDLDFAHDTFGLIDFSEREHDISKPIRRFAYHSDLNM